MTISGDSKDYLAALSYVLNLSNTDGLERCSSCATSRRTKA